MYFTDIVAIVLAVFSSYFLLFVTFGSTSPASQYVYTVSGHWPYTNTVYAIAALFDAHRQRCHVAALHASWPVDVHDSAGYVFYEHL